MPPLSPNAEKLIQLAREAGEAILAIYSQPDALATQTKADQSPLTAADLAAHECLQAGLPKILNVPVLSEESSQEHLSARHTWPVYWLVDPLDGTREFLARNGEFTINIALIVNHQPVMGLIHQPTTDISYLGSSAQNPLGIAPGATKWSSGDYAQSLQPLSTQKRLAAEKKLRVLISHRHGREATQALLEHLSKTLQCSIEPVSLGSALKFGFLAEGLADFYPRLAPTSEWDTAAGHALLRALGGEILAWPEATPLSYNTKDHLLNPHFLAFPDARFNWALHCSQF